MTELYETLGVAKDASPEEIHTAYRRRAKATHPDKGGSAEAFGAVNGAYRILSDPEKRERYDRTGHADDRPDNTEAASLELLDQLLNTMLNDASARYKDLVQAMQEVLAESILQHSGKIAKMVLDEAKTLDMLRRFRTKRSKNVLSMLLTRKLKTTRERISSMEAVVTAHEKAIAVLEDYEFDADHPPAFSTQILTTNNSTGGW